MRGVLSSLVIFVTRVTRRACIGIHALMWAGRMRCIRPCRRASLPFMHGMLALRALPFLSATPRGRTCPPYGRRRHFPVATLQGPGLGSVVAHDSVSRPPWPIISPPCLPIFKTRSPRSLIRSGSHLPPFRPRPLTHLVLTHQGKASATSLGAELHSVYPGDPPIRRRGGGPAQTPYIGT